MECKYIRTTGEFTVSSSFLLNEFMSRAMADVVQKIFYLACPGGSSRLCLCMFILVSSEIHIAVNNTALISF